MFKNFIAIAVAIVSTAVLALPEEPTVVSGFAQIAKGADVLLVTQNSAALVMDWRGFNIAAHETVHCVMPTITSVAVHRVPHAWRPTQIDGTLIANGQIILINPSGIVMSGTARIDAASFMATTANTTDSPLDPKANWFFKSGSSSVINRGQITAKYRHQVILLGSTVINTGRILGQGLDVFFLSGAQGLKFFNAMNDNHAYVEVPAKIGLQGSNLIVAVGMPTYSNILPAAINMAGIEHTKVVNVGHTLVLR